MFSAAPNITVTLYINNVATGVTITVPTSSAINVSTTGFSNESVVINAGDTFAFYVTQNTTGQVTRIATAIRYQAN
ncbi:hypothetical protein AMR72_02310 [Flavobacterium psychrophilum]|nr:hypothetical protein AMR72_02310 [Flavobacterium psychrophilum]AOE51456.1 hypothetical protein ALW18_02310 [Flavobacterium psychrophilum]